MDPQRTAARRPRPLPKPRRSAPPNVEDERSLGGSNQATTAILSAPAETPIAATDAVALQRSVGNQAVAQLVKLQRTPTDLAPAAAEHVNVVDAVHELRRAVDQSNTEMRGSWFWGKHPVRPVKFDVVDRVLLVVPAPRWCRSHRAGGTHTTVVP